MEANISPREIAFGVCLAMFLGFTPLNGTTALLLALFFFIFKINRMATLLTLPIFKTLYLCGISKLGDAMGSYILEKADLLTGFWRFVTHFPVIAYLDVNRTTVAGGLLLSAILSVPVYFLAKAVSIRLLAAYSAKMQNTAFAKWIGKFKVATKVDSFIAADMAGTVKKIRTGVTRHVMGKIKAAVIKPRQPKVKTGIMKRLNLGGIAVIIAVLVVIQAGIGLIISPMVSAFIIDSINRSGSAKITAEKINVWPLTLDLSIKELKVYDPKASDKRIVRVGNTNMHISPLALLSKRLVISSASMKDADIDLEGSPDGTYNIQHLAQAKSGAQQGWSAQNVMELWKTAQEKKDLFGMVYNRIRKTFSAKGQKDAKEARKNAGRVNRVAEDLPKGRVVNFKTAADMYLFEIRKLSLKGRVNITPYNGQAVELKDMKLTLKRLAFDPQNGARLDYIHVKGGVFKDNTEAGRIDFLFSKSNTSSGQSAAVKARLDNVDLDAVRFVYQDSLPVNVVRGRISLSSATSIAGNAINSNNSMTLTGHEIEPKQGGASVVGFVPIAAVCNALNQIDPVRIKFDIKGTVEKPEFSGFQETLLNLIKPYIANVGEQLKTQGVNALGQMLQKKLQGK